MKKLLVLLMSITLLTACGDKKIDASTPEKYQESLTEVVKDLNFSEAQSFTAALSKISMQAATEANYDNKKMEEIMKQKLDGKTVSEVIKLAEQIN